MPRPSKSQEELERRIADAVEARTEHKNWVRAIKADEPHLRLAMALLPFHRQKLYKALRHSSFEDYCRVELDMAPSTVSYHLQVARKIEEVGDAVSWETWVRFGITRARHLVTWKVPNDQFPKYIERFINTDSREVEDILKRENRFRPKRPPRVSIRHHTPP